MSVAPLRLLAATLLIGVIVGVAIIQLFGDGDARSQSSLSPVEPLVVVQAPTSATKPDAGAQPGEQSMTAGPESAAAGAPGGVDTPAGVAFVTRDQLESELPAAVVDLLVEHNAILVEEVPDVP